MTADGWLTLNTNIQPVVKHYRFDKRLYRVYSRFKTGCLTRLTTDLTTRCIVYTNIQPVVKPV